MKELTKKEFEDLSSLGKSLHPDRLMCNLVDLISEIGSTKFLHGAGLNKDRDSFVAVLFAYAIRKWSKREWFVQQIQDPPDFYLISPTDRTIKEKPVDRAGVEVVEIKDKTLEAVIETLERTKLTNYDPGEGTILLIFINSEVGLENLELLNIWIVNNREKFSVFSEIYILFINQFTTETIVSYTVVNALKAWAVSCKLIEDFNKGIIYPHPLIDKYMVKVKVV